MASNEEVENNILKSVFLVTVNQGDSGFTYLSKLAKNETTITTSDDSAEDLIPCDLCNKMIPFSYFSEHQVVCMQGGVDYIPVTAPKTTTVVSDPITRLNRTLIQRMILEKSPYAAGGLQYLIDCTDRANKFQNQHKDNKFVTDLLVDIKAEIIKGLKTLLIQEQNAPQDNSLYANNQIKSELLYKFDTIPEPILADLIQSCLSQELDTIFSVVIFELTYAVQVQVRDFDAFHPGLNACYQRLNRLLNYPQIINLAAILIDEEIVQSKNWSGSDLEKNSVLSKYFFMNTMGQAHAKKYFSQIPKYPEALIDEIKLMQKSLQGAIKNVVEMNHFNLKKIFLAKDNGKAKNSLLNWFATAIKLNDSKADLSPTDPLYLNTLALYGSDPFLVNLHCCLLEFCKPFLDTNFSKENLISPYYCAYSKRLDFGSKSKLAKAEKVLDFNVEQKLKEGEFTFVSEIFFLTLVSMHVGLMPAVRVYNSYQQALINTKNLQQKQIALYGELYANMPEGQKVLQNLNLYYLIVDGYSVHITHPDYMTLMHNMCMQFMHWMLKIYNENRSTEEGKNLREAIFATMPEYFVEDVIDYLTFIGRSEPNVFTLQMLEVMVTFCSTFVSDSKLIRSAIIRAKFLELLTEINFLGNQKAPAPPANYGFGYKQPASTTPILLEPLKSQFRDALHALKTSRQSLISGLFVLYCDVDSAVEGLDVDRHKFDKYVVRKSIATLVNQLWSDQEYRKVIKATLDVNEIIPFFKSDKFLGTVLSDSIMLLDDSLSRLADIKELQVAMANVEEWNKQLPERRTQREQYYEGQERSSKAFLNLANSILDFLVNLTKDFVEPFTKSPEVVAKLVSTINHFFEELCGPRMLNLKVKNPEKYNFHPRELLRKIVTLTLSFAKEPEFATALGKDLEYSPQIMQKAFQIISRERLVGEEGLNLFGELIAKVNSVVQPSGSQASEPAPDEMEVEDVIDNEKEMALEKIYVETLKPMIFDSFQMSKEEGDKVTYNHHYSNNIISSQSSSKEKMQRLAKECGTFDSQLPISRGSSIFVRTDEERMDVMKAVITGPKGTPYGSGCFVFDIFFPATYPQDPPLVNLSTTGNGTARFNPNLYTDGKVCLSLLGTWHGDASSKWNAVSSNLQQVLISIQGLIMVEEPYFNEPSYEAQRGTKEGDKRSHEYNENIQYNNIRFAMIEQLRNPPAEFAEVINLHFKLEKDAIVKQCEKWMKEASNDMKPKFARVIDELKKELAKL